MKAIEVENERKRLDAIRKEEERIEAKRIADKEAERIAKDKKD